MRQVKFGASDRHELRGLAIIGFIINAYLVHATVNTAFVLTSNVCDFVQVSVSAELKRGGRTITVFNDALYPLAYESGFKTGSIYEIQEANHTPVVLVVQTAALFHTIVMSAAIKLHDVICLTGSDELVFEVQPNSGALLATVSSANSWIEWDVIEGIGNGVSVPIIQTQSVRAAETKSPFPCGDNVISAAFINKDKVGVTSAVQVLETANMSSDKLNIADSYTELLSKRARQFETTANHQARNQSFILFDVRDPAFSRSPYDVRLNKVNINLKFTAANVNAAKNWLVVRGYENDAQTLVAAGIRDEKHAAANQAQYL